MTPEEKKRTYGALGVFAYLEDAIQKHVSQHGKKPDKIMVGKTESELLEYDSDNQYLVDGVEITCNLNSDHDIIIQ